MTSIEKAGALAAAILVGASNGAAAERARQCEDNIGLKVDRAALPELLAHCVSERAKYGTTKRITCDQARELADSIRKRESKFCEEGKGGAKTGRSLSPS